MCPVSVERLAALEVSAKPCLPAVVSLQGRICGGAFEMLETQRGVGLLAAGFRETGVGIHFESLSER